MYNAFILYGVIFVRRHCRRAIFMLIREKQSREDDNKNVRYFPLKNCKKKSITLSRIMIIKLVFENIALPYATKLTNKTALQMQ